MDSSIYLGLVGGCENDDEATDEAKQTEAEKSNVKCPVTQLTG